MNANIPPMRILLATLLLALPSAAPARDSSGSIGFALALHRKAAAQKPGENLMLSAYSVRQALGMALLGAGGATREEIARVLGMKSGFEREEKELRESLTSDPEVTLMIANALWLKKGFPFLGGFIARARENFAAQVFVRGFGAETLAEINGWVSRATHGKIPVILNTLAMEDRAVLLNAVYFKGKWATAFPKEGGKRSRFSGGPLPATFRPSRGGSFDTKLMSLSKSFAYAESANWQAVRLPYRGGRLAMLAVLPAEGSSLDTLRGTLDAATWSAMRSTLSSRSGLVAIPRFKFTGSYDLIPALVSLGVKDAFIPVTADFTGIAAAKTPEDRLHISQVKHKTFVLVDEEGTEAAAATAVSLTRSGSARGPEPFRFVADRPFLFAIEEVASGEILFLGEVHDPRK